jgi:hypothetical protein
MRFAANSSSRPQARENQFILKQVSARMWLNEFVALLSGKTITLQQIDQALDLKNQNLPNRLFKFRKADEFGLNNLQNDTLWICSPDRYNDPYECSTTIAFDRLTSTAVERGFDHMLTRVDLRKHLNEDEIEQARIAADPVTALGRALLGKDPSLPKEMRDDLLRIIEEVWAAHNDAMLARINRQLQRNTKVCSFSARNDSILMWSHYAKDHTGFCIEYAVDRWPTDFRRMLYPVTYSTAQFDVTDYLTQSIETPGNFNNLFGHMAATRKSSDWSYEEEWRFVMPIGDAYPDQNFPAPRPIAIHLGARATPEDVERLTDIAITKGLGVFQMRLSNTEFRMTSEPLGATKRAFAS